VGTQQADAPQGLPADRPSAATVRTLLELSLPAVVVGIVSALVLYAVEEVVHLLEHAVWVDLADSLGVDPASPWWILGVLSVTGLVVGLVIRLVPGHGGQDSATVELIAPPVGLRVVPSLALVAVVGFAGGVSLGPEAPIIAINTALLVALVRRLWPAVPTRLVVMVTAAGTIGALFGTPVAAALVFTGLSGASAAGEALWDRLFLPLLSAASGALTMTLLASPTFSIELPGYDEVAAVDLLSAALIALVAALVGIAAAAVFPLAHAAFRMLGSPVLYCTAGGVLLGVLGVIGGDITLFKGLAQMGELVADRADYGVAALVLIILVKAAALVVSAAAGFRGGRIFPAVFTGVAVGVLANALVPGIPLTVAVASGVLGAVLAIAREGWIALFIAVAVTGSITVLPVLCIAILPTWLLVSRAPEMIVHEPAHSRIDPNGARRD